MKILAQRRVTLVLAATGAAILLLALACALIVALSRDDAHAAGVVDVGMPAAAIVPFGGSTPPPGWLIADGSEVSRVQYPDLFAVIGTTYGAGNGSTTFNLPDLRGRVVAGLGTNLEVDALTDSDGLPVGSRTVTHKHGLGTLSASGGSHTHTITDPGHTHTINDPGHTHTINDPGHTHGGAANVALPGFPAGPDGSVAEMGDLSQAPRESQWLHVDRNTTGITINSRTTGITVNSKTTGITVNSATLSLPNSAFSGSVGDTNGPLDGPAYQVLYYIVKY